MKKILYLMGIDWYWIKQRPQIIALELNRDYQVSVVYLSEIFNRTGMRHEKDKPACCKGVPAVPYRDKNKIAFWLEKILMKCAIGNVCQYDIVWVGHPSLFKYISLEYSGKIIYDCMDDHMALCLDKKIRWEIDKNENALIARADIVFATSQALKEKVEALGGAGKTFLNRNGFQYENIYPLKRIEKKEKYKIGYIGTIAEWMDFDLLQESLRHDVKVEYYLIGPVHHVSVPKVPGIILKGTVEHSQLYEKIRDYDCLIMPFTVNDVVRAVDPVKLYEYISMGKCVISVWYEEIDRFAPYVYFYQTQEEFSKLLSELCDNGFPPKYNSRQQQEFLKTNSWKIRYKEIRRIMESGQDCLDNEK